MNIVRTDDLDYVKGILFQPGIEEFIGDDYSQGWEPEFHPLFFYLRNEQGGCLAMFYPMNGVTWQIHIAVVKKMRRYSVRFGKSALSWMFSNTRCKKIVAMIPAYNTRANALARITGMNKEGRLAQSIQSNGELHDLLIYGIGE